VGNALGAAESLIDMRENLGQFKRLTQHMIVLEELAAFV
jgi:hypothetical protein